MNKFEKWFFKRIVRKEVVQGYNHKERILEMYTIITEACRDEFHEDSLDSLDAFLKKLFEEANKHEALDEFQEVWHKVNRFNKGISEYELAKLIYEKGKENSKPK